MMPRTAAALALAAGLAATPVWADCKPSDIKIKNWDWRIDDKTLHVVGEIINTCRAPVIIEFQAVTRDTAGKVVAANEFYSAGKSVLPGDSSAFEHLEDWNAKGKSVDLKVIDTTEPYRGCPGKDQASAAEGTDAAPVGSERICSLLAQ